MTTGKLALVDDAGYVTRMSPPSNTTGADREIVFANETGSATQAFKVADAVNANEALSKQQLLTEIKAVDGAGSGLDADLVDGVQGALLGIGGAGYAWVDETANRVAGVTYTNTSGKPIYISILFNGALGVGLGVTVDTMPVQYFQCGTSLSATVAMLIPNGSTYLATNVGGTPTIDNWLELK